MQLLYIDKDQSVARSLHGEFLSYRGMHWDLVHCAEQRLALKWIDEGNFQAVLYRSQEDAESVRCELNQMLSVAGTPPIVAVLESISEAVQLELINDGVHDSLTRSKVTGQSIMRRLRMAEVRRAAWDRMAPTIDCETLLAAQLRVDQRASEPDSKRTEASFDELDGETSPLWFLPRKLRVAHVASSSPLIGHIDLASAKDCRLDFAQFDNVRSCLDELTKDVNSFHAMVIENSIFESEPQSALADLDPYLRLLPCSVLTVEKSDFAALSYLERGFADCLTVAQLSLDSMAQLLCKTVTRHRRQLALAINELQVGDNVSERRKVARAGSNRRKQVRYLFQRPLLAIPLLPNGAPDTANLCYCMSIDVSLGGMALTIPNQNRIPNRNWVIGVEQPDRQYHYVSAYLRRVAYQADQLLIGLVFQQDAEDFLHPANLMPDLDHRSKQFEYRTAENILRQWAELGVLRHQLLRRVKVCPECAATCVVGTGCNQCGSFGFEFQDLIHHFACAHVGAAATFHRDDSFACPKCLQSELVVGADFEVIKSRYECHDCGHAGTELVEVCSCLGCQLRFPLSMADEIDVFAYDVERLDVLALVNAAR